MMKTKSRPLVAEFLGSMFLIIAVIGSGIMATRMSPNDVGLQLLENAAATTGALIALILVFGSVSGAHFNPVVTAFAWFERKIETSTLISYAVVQTAGACTGAIVANLMFELDAINLSTKDRSSGAHWLAEVVATLGLLLVIHGCSRGGKADAIPYAVGVWIGGAYWFTSSTSFANPAVTVARMLSDSFAGIKPEAAPMFIVMQLLGLAIAIPVINFLWPPRRTPEVLFVCIHNAGRSQMAAAFLRTLGGRRVRVRSAGTAPAATINPVVVEVMREKGIDLHKMGAEPKLLEDAAVQSSDYVITMGCGDECPFYPGKEYRDWVLADPAGQGAESVRPIRDQIEVRVRELLAELDS
jgi:arsenate reductase